MGQAPPGAELSTEVLVEEECLLAECDRNRALLHLGYENGSCVSHASNSCGVSQSHLATYAVSPLAMLFLVEWRVLHLGRLLSLREMSSKAVSLLPVAAAC